MDEKAPVSNTMINSVSAESTEIYPHWRLNTSTIFLLTYKKKKGKRTFLDPVSPLLNILKAEK